MKKTLRKVEELRLFSGVPANVNIHDMLSNCPNLKMLTILNTKINTDFMNQRYYKLEHFEKVMSSKEFNYFLEAKPKHSHAWNA